VHGTTQQLQLGSPAGHRPASTTAHRFASAEYVVKKSNRKGHGGADAHPSGPDRFYSISEVAGLVEVVPRTVRRWIDDGLLIAHRIRRVVRVSESDFQTFLAEHRD
jgi:excisionase family DNA binding protein